VSSLPRSQTHATCHNHEPIDPGHTLPSYSSKIHFNNISIFKLQSLQEVSYPRSQHQNPVFVSFLAHTRHMLHPPLSSWSDHRLIFDEHCRPWSTSLQSSPASDYFIAEKTWGPFIDLHNTSNLAKLQREQCPF